MKSRKLVLLSGAASMAAMFTQSTAQAEQPFYVSLGAGVNILSDIDLNSDDFDIPQNTRQLEFDTGVAVLGAVGYRFSSYFRAEGEVSYRRNGYDDATVQNEGPAGINGDITAFGVMLNGWVDIPTGTVITPYFGGGIGGAHVSLDADYGPLDSGFFSEQYDFNDSDFVFAYQFGGGVAIGNPDGIQITLDYRYFNADGMNVDFSGVSSGTAQSSDYESHSGTIGVRIPFGYSSP
ncbi:outer membrane protein [Pararhizobium sp. IMCC21322]|uniref:outer membrane protein n=1 Tax=Pararhizobium sp. IMCC21322 TaxID=3067903 RepID=UPI002740944E|nr:porin family protein [Pararhizobium sp. IMCC21322]